MVERQRSVAREKKITGFDVRNINKIFFADISRKPAQLKSEILKALENVPNELNKRFESM
uniref:Uncharacterized protein n=1 Tax=Salmonella sp. TaxID=599 RepID=A0A482ETZ4_SALSP|nr:hypothetical protein [Salmonella sp.]QBM91546.1 hypothetical protein NNIBIDOC_00220 [Salmonella sp.]